MLHWLQRIRARSFMEIACVLRLRVKLRVARCTLHVACSMLPVACCVLHVVVVFVCCACCMTSVLRGGLRVLPILKACGPCDSVVVCHTCWVVVLRVSVTWMLCCCVGIVVCRLARLTCWWCSVFITVVTWQICNKKSWKCLKCMVLKSKVLRNNIGMFHSRILIFFWGFSIHIILDVNHPIQCCSHGDLPEISTPHPQVARWTHNKALDVVFETL